MKKTTKGRSTKLSPKIVVVEDSRTQAEYLVHLLTGKGYDVLLALNGREALDRIRMEMPSVVLTDIVMPEMDGYELCRQIKTDVRTAGIQVILVTQLFDAEDVLRGLEAGADNFIIKPYNPEQVYSHIEAAFRAVGKPDPEGPQPDMEYVFSHRSHRITSGRFRILDILLSTYEYAIRKNIELQEMQENLSATNEELTSAVEDLHTANRNLVVENAERGRVERALAEANSKLNLLTSITRHDINNQILALTAYIDLAEMRITDPVVLDYIKRSKIAAQIIQKQIEFTKTYESIGDSTPQWQDAGKIMESLRPYLESAAIDLEIRDLSFELYADSLLPKVFGNLIDNSIRHGKRVKHITLSSTRKENGNLCIEYRDDGEGVVENDKERIFSKGFGKNTGLGLFLSRVILGITGISIRETGIPGKGARFEIIVPSDDFRIAGS
ncbi:response regulator [uncultured Methanoregula sp.]|uniref:hybrid sensor histidine kinase/response regulator n=1 Tax=uncultured Methanoregula sp. TaxID=1005933 RepID=UPI002AAC311E|nr:response regulator [uncultured Methanoregula sp.]